MPHDEKGEVTDEALVYSEWRYINYLRFIDIRGVAPCDCPPPWDVALIWYLHLLSPTRFQRHIWNSKSVNTHYYGLEHRHFPFSALANGEWRPKKTVRAWDRWSSLTDGRRPGPNLPYQLWPSPPWEPETAGRRRSGIFSSLFSRDKVLQPGPQKLAKAEGAPPQPQLAFDRPVIMHEWNRCFLGTVTEMPATWDITSYTNFRTWRRSDRCHVQSQHESFRQQCELTPWPSVADLRADLNRQVPFWKILTQVARTQPGFVQGLEAAVQDYESFISLFHGNMVRRRQYISRWDSMARPPDSSQTAPGGRFVTLVPPTLEVDLLWHTHRMFPAKYWLWSSAQAGWLVEYQTLDGVAAAGRALEKTRSEWQRRLGSMCPENNGLGEWLEEYVPDAARFAPEDCETTNLRLIILGLRAWKGRRYNPYRDRDNNSTTTGGGGAGGAGPVGDGCGGGDGGGGGGGGGGE